MAAEIGVVTALIAWIEPLPLGLTAPIVFTAVEFLFPSLFPWRLAHTQYLLTPLLQTGELAGPSLLTFAMVWLSAGMLAALRIAQRGDAGPRVAAGSPAALWSIAAPALLLVALTAWGGLRLRAVEAARARAPALRVGVVQGNIDVVRKGDRSFFTRNLEEYRALSRAVATDVDLLIWPETVVQHHLPLELLHLSGDDSPFPDTPRPLVFGGLGIDTAHGDRRLFNSAFLLLPDGRVAGRYDKQVLVPFGEYMPFGDQFPRLRALSPATSNFSAGHAATLLPATATARIGSLICYEDVIPGPARAAVAQGATLLLNLTNDAWYGRSAEPIQHQALAVWRAVENRRDLVRSTNTGLTSVVSATGRVLAELPIFEAATLTAEVRLLEGRTFYGAAGDLFAWGVVMALLAILVERCRQRRAAGEAARSPAGGRIV